MRVAGALPSVIHQIRRWIFTAVTSRGEEINNKSQRWQGITHIISGSSPISGKLPPDNRITFPRAHPHSPHTAGIEWNKEDLGFHVPAARIVKLSPTCLKSLKLGSLVTEMRGLLPRAAQNPTLHPLILLHSLLSASSPFSSCSSAPFLVPQPPPLSVLHYPLSVLLSLQLQGTGMETNQTFPKTLIWT